VNDHVVAVVAAAAAAAVEAVIALILAVAYQQGEPTQVGTFALVEV
jgi:hypothetical protein